MLKHPNQLTDDLFEKSSMSFGEHLEELRKALIKAALWLAAGTTIGFLAANSVVSFIKAPLEEELNKFYVQQAKYRFKTINNRPAPEALLNWMIDNAVMPERVFVDPTQLKRTLLAEDSKPGGETKENTAAPSQSKPTPEQTSKQQPSEKQTSEKPTSEKQASEPTKAEIAAVTPEDSPAANTDPAVPKQTESKPDVAEKVADKEVAKKEESSTKTTIPGFSVDEAQSIAWGDLTDSSIENLRPIIMLRPTPNRIQAVDVLEPFMIWLKASLLVGAVVASPGIFWHIWDFLAAGLYPHERRYVYMYLPLSVTLFISGVALAFFVIFRLVIGFLLTYNLGFDIDIAPRLNEFVSFALFLPLGFGIAFQLPIVMLALNRFGIASVEMYKSKWRIAVLGIAFVSMVLTPADAYSMLGMFIPLTVLYFFGIALCIYMPKGPGIGSTAFDPQG